ncbi:MAG TPA: hypothetical protein EYQ51_05270 [Alphaproteobacteria bacterium]|nr:hypothetical protein [Alphaproteobacteria bacterium]
MVLKFRLLSLVIIYTILLGCNKQQNKSSSVDNYEKINYFSDSINTVRINNISLTTINVLNNWIEYQELKEVISSLENNEFSFFKDNKEYISRFFDGLKKSIPKSINKPGIIARTAVLETKFLILESYFTSNIIDEKQKKNRINDVLSANSNFIYQINKLIERSNQKIED